jgi:hypothetical protein
MEGSEEGCWVNEWQLGGWTLGLNFVRRDIPSLVVVG